jgi:hypothetical protein
MRRRTLLVALAGLAVVVTTGVVVLFSDQAPGWPGASREGNGPGFSIPGPRSAACRCTLGPSGVGSIVGLTQLVGH